MPTFAATMSWEARTGEGAGLRLVLWEALQA